MRPVINMTIYRHLLHELTTKACMIVTNGRAAPEIFRDTMSII